MKVPLRASGKYVLDQDGTIVCTANSHELANSIALYTIGSGSLISRLDIARAYITESHAWDCAVFCGCSSKTHNHDECDCAREDVLKKIGT